MYIYIYIKCLCVSDTMLLCCFRSTYKACAFFFIEMRLSNID